MSTRPSPCYVVHYNATNIYRQRWKRQSFHDCMHMSIHDLDSLPCFATTYSTLDFKLQITIKTNVWDSKQIWHGKIISVNPKSIIHKPVQYNLSLVQPITLYFPMLLNTEVCCYTD
jgi:hypothetical protein